MTCPACGGSLLDPECASVPDFEHGVPVEVDFARCRSCGSLCLSPAPTPEALASFYPDDYRAHSDSPLVAAIKSAQARAFLRCIRDWLPDHSQPILELGCGAGYLLGALRRAGFSDLTGVDQNLRMAEPVARQGAQFLPQRLDRELLFDRPVHTILLHYLLEHIPEPRRMLAACRELLVKGGQILCLTPNASAWSRVCFGRYWSGLHAPRHTVVLSPLGIEKLAARAGLSVAEQRSHVDSGSWAVSMQNIVVARARRRRALHRGTSALLPALAVLTYPFARAESLAGHGSSLLVRITA